jgi:arabinofuranosyltransferase
MTKDPGKREPARGCHGARARAETEPVSETEHRERRGLQLSILLGVSLVLLILGWRLFWFLTDDAFISFRYISNGHFGYGYVWNPPPFQPVEGYTNFLWMLILDGVWRLLRVPPPVSANWVSLVFSCLTIIVLVFMMLRMEWSAGLRRHRYLIVGLGVLFLLVNRSFLAWTSSGLETALFTCLIALWTFCALSPGWGFRRRAVSTTLAAALMALTRPDGLLYVAATIVLLGIAMLRRRGEIRIGDWLALSPLLIVPAHEAWRRAFYGEWLPNSYHAKLVAAWPASGALYALSFIMEYALWAWIAVGVVALLRRASRASMRRDLDVSRIIVVVAMLGNFLYYTFVVGGDHFEYRVYNHLLIFVPVTFLWFLNRLALEWRRAAAVLSAFIALSLPVPWTHWAFSHDLNTRVLTFRMYVSVAKHWPVPFRWYGRLFDKVQFRLIDHSVCMRHQEHKICYEYLCEENPTREEGMRISGDGYPVHTAAAVGVVSWVLPHVNIIDALGLNDYVIARMPLVEGAQREMAHDRHAPQDYVACFDPNVFIEDRRITIKKRAEPLTAENIRACEREWRALAKRVKEKKVRVILRTEGGRG